MKILRMLSVPFAVAADFATLGNMGGRSFTQQVFDADRADREVDAAVKIIRAVGAASSNRLADKEIQEG